MLSDVIELLRDARYELTLLIQRTRIVRRDGVVSPFQAMWRLAKWAFEEILDWAWIGVWLVVVGCVMMTPILIVLYLIKQILWG